MAPDRQHEDYAIAIVEPAPLPEEIAIFRNMVSNFVVNDLGRAVLDAQPWIQGVGLFRFRSALARQALVDHPPFNLGNDRFVRFIPHDEGINYRATQGFRRGWVMLLGVPLDYRRSQYFADVISTFGRFHHWHQDDPMLIRSLAYVSFPAPTLVPRSVTYREYADFGGARISWSAPVYILSADFADVLPADEDPMPFNGNPHPLPGNLQFDNHNWVMPEFPELGWNDVPHPVNEQQHNDVHPVQEAVQHEEVQEIQSQESIVLQHSDDSVNNVDNAAEVAVFQPPMGPQQPPLLIGQVFTIYGPILPPEMQWQRTFEKMLPFMWSSDIPQFVFKSDIGALLNKQSWEILCNALASNLQLLPAPASPICSVPAAPVKRPVARALCFDDIAEPVAEAFEFSAVPQVSLKRGRKPKASRVIVDSEVRRSARLSALHDGYRKVTAGTPSKKPHTLKKRKTMAS